MVDSCVMFPLRREAAAFLASRPCELIADAPCPAWRADCDGLPVLVVETGVGAKGVTSALEWVLREHRPSYMLLAGFAGGLSPKFPTGAVILVEDCLDEVGQVFALTWPCHSEQGVNVPRGRLLTTSHMIADVAEKRRLAERSGADLVDMEATHAAKICAERSVPFGCLRVVLDDVQTPLSPNLLGLLAGGRVRWGKLMWGIVRRPWIVAELMRLGRQSKVAGQRLAEALTSLIGRV